MNIVNLFKILEALTTLILHLQILITILIAKMKHFKKLWIDFLNFLLHRILVNLPHLEKWKLLILNLNKVCKVMAGIFKI